MLPIIASSPLKAFGLSDIAGVDFTLLAALLAGMAGLYCVITDAAVMRYLLPLLVFILTLVPSVLATVPSEYSSDKVSKFFVLSLPVAVSVALVAAQRQRLAYLFDLVLLAAAFAALGSLVAPTNADLYGRSAIGGNTLILGYFSGAGVLVLIWKLLDRRLALAWGLVLGMPLLAIMVSSGSRGPLLALVLGACVLLLSRPTARQIAVAPLMVGIAALALTVAPQVSLDRFSLIFSEDKGASANVRVDLWRYGLEAFSAEPFTGVGFANFQFFNDYAVIYPHNLFVELLVEAGVIGLLGAVVFLIASFGRYVRVRRVPEVQGALSLAAFWFVGAMFSGDLTNRELLMWVTIGLLAPALLRPTGSDDAETEQFSSSSWQVSESLPTDTHVRR